jgi:hypothetical protein
MIAENAAALSVRLIGSTTTRVMDTPTLIGAMLDSGEGISDLVFSPGRPPQVERYGH